MNTVNTPEYWQRTALGFARNAKDALGVACTFPLGEAQDDFAIRMERAAQKCLERAKEAQKWS